MIREYEKGTDLQLSQNFWLREFHCHCTRPECLVTLVSDELVSGLQEIRNVLGRLKINRGFSCEAHNAAIGGKEHSRHKIGDGADVVYLGGSPFQLEQQAKRTPVFIQGGIGLYKWGCHLDTRGKPTRWINLK